MRGLITITLFIIYGCYSIEIFAQTDHALRILNPKSILTKEQLVKDKEALKNYHPNPFNSFPESEWDSLIDVIAIDLPREPIRESEKTLIRRKLLDRVTFEDPHLRFIPTFGKEGSLKVKMKKINALPFTLINISDTLLIDKSFDENIFSGDRILSINNVDAVTYLESSYRDRYMSGYALQTFYHFSFTSNYNIKLVRNNQQKEIIIHGMPIDKGFFQKMYRNIEAKIFDENEIGYFSISNFDNNKYLVKHLNRFLDKLIKKGYKNVIIDIRKNTGGGGDYFDELMSMLTNKAKIPLQSGAKLKVSKATYKYYYYTEDDFGKLVDLPDSLIVKEGLLDISKYKGNINYFVLISKTTASMAASFANMVQYNDIGLLVGEPLAHNALNYGEVITAERDNSFWTISTIENFQYTNAENGVLKPNISIPFVASEYMKGGDPVLEKCMEYIKNNQK